MAELLGVKKNFVLGKELEGWLKEKIENVFDNVSSPDTNTLNILTKDGTGISRQSGNNWYVTTSSKIMVIFNMAPTTIGLYKAESGIIILLKDSSVTLMVAYNKDTNAICGVMLQNASLTNSKQIVYYYVGKNGITDTNRLASEVMIRDYTAVNLNVCLTELICNGEQTGIYALTDGWVINGTVSDGTTDVFIPWLIGLPD